MYNFLTIHKLLLSPNCGVDPSTPFHFIVPSDAKNIKVSLNFLAKYIQGKQVDGNKANNLSDFDGMGDVMWNFISSVYVSK